MIGSKATDWTADGNRETQKGSRGNDKTTGQKEQGHAARNDPAQFHLFSSSSVFSFATLPGFCDIRILT